MYRDDDFGLDYELTDDAKFHKDCERLGSFEDFLKEIGKPEKQVRQEYSKFMLWLEVVRQRFGLKNMQKALFCRSVCNALKNEYSSDLARLWCMCFSEYSDFLFEKQGDCNDNDYMKYRIGQFARLSEDIDNTVRRLGNETENRERFTELCKNITYSEEAFLKIDVDDFYRIITEGVGLEGKFLKDNLLYICEKISHSKELSQIAPNVFYALIMRYRKKLSDAEGFMPNFKSAMRFIEYEIGKDNGKNQDIYMDHIVIYQGMCEYFSECGRDLCDAGFACMSNLCENDSLEWHEFPLLTRPLGIELREKYFSCFPNGMEDNPIFAASDIDVNDMLSYEDYYDEMLPPKARIICHVREYLANCNEPAEQYITLLEKGETDKCMKIIHDIIEKSEISPEFIKPEMADVVNAVIMEEVLENISDTVKSELLALLSYLQGKLKC